MKKTVIFVPISTRTLANLLGNNACEELNDLIALYELIDYIDEIKEKYKESDNCISWAELDNSLDKLIINVEDCFPTHYSYNKWFNEIFMEDYNLALKEVEQQTIPSDRELCILRLAREAVYKYVDVDNLYKFCKEYLIDITEYSIFWNEYYYCKQHKFFYRGCKIDYERNVVGEALLRPHHKRATIVNNNLIIKQ